MLPRTARLPRSEIRRLIRYGKKIMIPEFQFVYGQNNIAASRFVFIVSTKIDKRATVRNRLRRLLSESVRHLWLQIPAGWDFAVIAQRQLLGKTRAEIETILSNLFSRTGKS